MTEENSLPSDPTLLSLKIIKVLIKFVCPKNSSELEKWLRQVGSFQKLLADIWQSDPTGSIMVKCLNLLYNEIALNSTPVSPVVWKVLDLVREDKIEQFVEGILSDPNTNENVKVKNVLIAIIEGLCQCGPLVPGLQNWIPVIIKGLESRQNYAVLVEVSEKVITRLINSLVLSLFRPLTYPVFRQLLYPVVTPHVFYKIIDVMPKTIHLLLKEVKSEETKKISTDFAALIRTLMFRFPPNPDYEAKYHSLKTSLLKLPECDFESDSMILWDLKLSGKAFAQLQTTNPSKGQGQPRAPYKGLVNQGNTCFMNSVLQLLYMTTRFRKEILEKELDPSDTAGNELQQLFAFMQESERSVLTPHGVLDSTLPPTFHRGHQQDSSEYLIYLLDTLHENEKKTNGKCRKVLRKSLNKNKDGNGDFDEETTYLNATDDGTLVERLFGGMSISTTICSSCKKSFPRNSRFRDLHLSLPDNYKSCDLQELVDGSLQSEELYSENMYDCGSCGAKRNATRKHIIVRAPQHLILMLKLFRFDPVRKQRLKLNGKLTNYKSIELPVYNSRRLQTRLVVYDLKGVVLHSGSSLDGGHYYSSAVDQSGQWFIFNDSVVSVAQYEWNSGGGTPYILLLRQADIIDPPAGPLRSNLQLLVNRDNQKFLAEKSFSQRTFTGKRGDDDWDDPPPSNGSFGGPGPSLVF